MSLSFLDKIQQLPSTEATNTAFCQITTSPSGMFISQENAQKVGFKPGSSWKEKEKEFANESVKGYFTTTPRIVVLKQSNIGMFRDAQNSRTGRAFSQFIGEFDGEVYNADKKNITLKTRYLIILVDDNGLPLVESPLNLTLKGGIAYYFATSLKETRIQAQEVLRKLTGKTLAFNSDVFSYLIFAPTIGKYTTEYKSTATKIDSVLPITTDTLESLLGMTYPETEALIKSILASDPVVEFATQNLKLQMQLM